MKCKAQTPKANLNDLYFPKRDEKQDVKNFLKLYGKRLKKNQIDLLKLMNSKIYGFSFVSHEMMPASHSFEGKPINTCEFEFEHDGAKGKITIVF